MSPQPEFHQVTSRVAIWHRFDPQVKVELSTTLLQTEHGAFVVDPFAPVPAEIAALIAGGIAAVILTNGNHTRAANDFSVAVFARAAAHPELSLPQAQDIASAALPPDLRVVRIEGAGTGETALHYEAEGGTLVMG